MVVVVRVVHVCHCMCVLETVWHFNFGEKYTTNFNLLVWHPLPQFCDLLCRFQTHMEKYLKTYIHILLSTLPRLSKLRDRLPRQLNLLVKWIWNELNGVKSFLKMFQKRLERADFAANLKRVWRVFVNTKRGKGIHHCSKFA